jgi:hypothetical protein
LIKPIESFTYSYINNEPVLRRNIHYPDYSGIVTLATTEDLRARKQKYEDLCRNRRLAQQRIEEVGLETYLSELGLGEYI